MSDLGLDNAEDTVEPPGLHPDLRDFQSLPWPEGAQDTAQELATRANDYVQQRALADNAAAAGQHAVTSVANFRDNLVSAVQADPHSVHTALDMVRPWVSGVIDTSPAHPDAEREASHDAISGDIESAIAHAAVQRMAEINEPAARGLLANDRISGLLDDGQKAGLGSYIDMQALARGADDSAQRQQLGALQGLAGAKAAIGHASTLYNPDIDTVMFPPGWAQSLMANNAIQPADKAALMHLYGRLQSQGDAPQSDPSLVARALNSIASGTMPSHADIIANAGTNLRVADALHLAGGAGLISQDQRAHYSQLADTVEQARQALVGRDGENGAAGNRAWGAYVNWLLPNARRGAVNFVDPDLHPLGAVPRFAPSDYVEPPSAPSPEGRPSLKEIFGR